MSCVFLVVLSAASFNASGLTPIQDSPQRRLHIAGAVQQARLVEGDEPIYPEAAKRDNVFGDVRLRLVVARDGSVSHVEVIEGQKVRADAVMAAVRKWKYRPTVVDGEAVEVVTTLDARFTLAGAPRVSVTEPNPAAQVARFREELAGKPADASAYRNLGFALIRDREIEPGITALRESLRLEPANTALRMRLAEILLKEKFDFHAAASEFQELRRRRPDDARVCLTLARAHEFVYDWTQAILQYVECSRLRPQEMEPFERVALALYRTKGVERATTEFRAYAAAFNDPATLHLHLANVLQMTIPAAALAQAQEALRVNPELTKARQTVEALERVLAELQQTLSTARTHVTLFPQDPGGYWALSGALHGLGDHEGALATLKEMSAAIPTAQNTELADEAAEVKGLAGAITELRALARAQRGSATARQALAQLLLRAGSAYEAAEVAREAMRLAPDSWQVRHTLSAALAAAGDAQASRSVRP